MKRFVWLIVALLLGIGIGAAGGYGVGVHVGEDRAFDKTATFLHQGGTPPWAGQGDEGLALCLTLSEGEDAGTRCLTEVEDDPVAEEVLPPANSDSGSPTPQSSPTVAPTASATPSPTPSATARPTRDDSRD